jgi:nitroreductase
MNKKALNTYPIHDLLQSRWSPRAFTEQPVEPAKLFSMFEAARWSPSGANSQPWAYIVTTPADPEPHARLLATLGERNQVWAKNAPVLVLAIAQREREPGQTNLYAIYDLGQSVAHLSVEAGDLGLAVHQMAGFDRMKAGEVFKLPAGYEAITVFAIGYTGSPDLLPDELRQRELAVRTRKPISQFVFDGAWEKPLVED